MLTIEKVKEQIAELEKSTEGLDMTKKKDKREYDKIGKRVAYLREIIMFLEAHPTQEMVERERLRAQALLQKFNTREHYKTWYSGNKKEADAVANAQALHDRIFDIKKHKRHYDNAGFILQVNG